MIRAHVLICGGTGCTSSGSKAIQDAFTQQIEANGLAEEVKVVQTGCFGLCALGPVVIVYPDGTFYSRVTAEDVKEIVSEHLLKGRPVERLIYNETSEPVQDSTHSSLNDTTFYKSQHRVALRNCGVIDPEDIDDYIAHGGYAAIEKVLKQGMSPDEVIEQIEREAEKCGAGKKKAALDPAAASDDGDEDPMLRAALELAVESRKISTSLIQRRLSLGYGRAAKLIDKMEQMGYVSAPDGQKPREVLISKEEFMEMALRDE